MNSLISNINNWFLGYDKLIYFSSFDIIDIYKENLRRVESINKLRRIYNRLFSVIASELYFLYIRTRVGMWEGISRPGNGRDGIGGKDP